MGSRTQAYLGNCISSSCNISFPIFIEQRNLCSGSTSLAAAFLVESRQSLVFYFESCKGIGVISHLRSNGIDRLCPLGKKAGKAVFLCLFSKGKTHLSFHISQSYDFRFLCTYSKDLIPVYLAVVPDLGNAGAGLHSQISLAGHYTAAQTVVCSSAGIAVACSLVINLYIVYHQIFLCHKRCHFFPGQLFFCIIRHPVYIDHSAWHSSLIIYILFADF